jgi:hypothetical protein
VGGDAAVSDAVILAIVAGLVAIIVASIPGIVAIKLAKDARLAMAEVKVAVTANDAKTDALHAKVEETQADVHRVEHATNGMKKALEDEAHERGIREEKLRGEATARDVKATRDEVDEHRQGPPRQSDDAPA